MSKELGKAVFERDIDWASEPLQSFVLTLPRLEFLIERGWLTWESIEESSPIPDISQIVNNLARERGNFENLEIIGFMSADRFVVDGVKVKAKRSFPGELYELFCQILSVKRPSDFTFKNNAISVRWS